MSIAIQKLVIRPLVNRGKLFVTLKNYNSNSIWSTFNRPTNSIPNYDSLTHRHSVGFTTSVINNAMFNVQDEEDFREKVIKSDTPVVVDFYANWCGPCKLLGPRLEGIIGGKGDKVHLAKIDIDSVSDLALEYGVSAVPSVLGIKHGKVVDKFVGLQEETRIDAFVNKLIGK